jgi:hypothetical protein
LQPGLHVCDLWQGRAGDKETEINASSFAPRLGSPVSLYTSKQKKKSSLHRNFTRILQVKLFAYVQMFPQNQHAQINSAYQKLQVFAPEYQPNQKPSNDLMQYYQHIHFKPILLKKFSNVQKKTSNAHTNRQTSQQSHVNSTLHIS